MNEGLKEWAKVATDFLAEIGVAAEARVLRDLRRLAVERHRLRDITESIRDGVFELKTKHGGMQYRCFYAFNNNEIIVLVCFEKKTRKAPNHLIDLAISRLKHIKRNSEQDIGDIKLH